MFIDIEKDLFMNLGKDFNTVYTLDYDFKPVYRY